MIDLEIRIPKSGDEDVFFDKRECASYIHPFYVGKAEELKSLVDFLAPSPGRDCALDTLGEILRIDGADPYYIPAATFRSWEDYDMKVSLFRWLLEGSPGWS